ncbi:MAG: hypothetical protein WA705_16620 [Candidatus Ozemobacteraceae bacterium]
MTSIFRKKAEHAQNAKFVMMRVAALAPQEIKSLIHDLTSLVWAKNYKMAEQICLQNVDLFDQYTEVRDLLCTVLPRLAQFVEVRKKAAM